MNWRPVADAFVRYSLAYAGLTVLSVALLTRREDVVAALFFAGLILLLFTKGMGDVRVTEPTAGEALHATEDQRTVIDVHTRLPLGGALFFYGLGLAIFGFGGMALVGSFMG
ncbi:MULTISPECIES: hypothetical protein [Halorussus]|uniref:hypothetical protein n=1 Tax=Halorussus TaxID=1070314 RepID=UPI00209F2D07|nr:hypothetical protein [Halorussus vallis]USZ76720.1 hypothetical protein NGM07_05185 [Halorussus vallis]